MSDERYEYQRINAVKIIVENGGKVLLIREPLTNEWMPGHWGLPGGKPFVKESILEAYKRKVEGDLGVNLDLLGVFRVVELLIENRTVFMFIFVAKYQGGDLKGEVSEFKWVTADEISSMDVAEFTEYYNKELLLDYLGSERNLVPVDFIKSYDYYQMGDEPEYKRWKESGTKK